MLESKNGGEMQVAMQNKWDIISKRTLKVLFEHLIKRILKNPDKLLSFDSTNNICLLNEEKAFSVNEGSFVVQRKFLITLNTIS